MRAPLAESTQKTIDEAVRRIVMQGYEQALSILKQHRALLERCARELLEQETLDAQALARLTEALRSPELEQKSLFETQ